MILEFVVLKFSVYTSMGIYYSLGTKFHDLTYPRKTTKIDTPQTIVLSQYFVTYNSQQELDFSRVYIIIISVMGDPMGSQGGDPLHSL